MDFKGKRQEIVVRTDFGRTGRCVWYGMICLIMASGADAQAVAYVESLRAPNVSEAVVQGNAWLFHRGQQCYAATPRHVLVSPAEGRDDRFARIVVVRAGRTPVEAEGQRCAVFKTEDLAVLRVAGVENLADCGGVFAGVADVDPLLAQSQGASLVTAAASGRFERSDLGIRAVTASDPGHFWVAPEADRDRLTEGMSGGLVMIQDQIAGFLLSVGSDQGGPSAGMARVLRADRAAVLLTRLLDGTASTSEVEGSCSTAVAVHGAGPESGLNRASAQCGASVVGWSAPSASAATRPENLLGANGPDGRWRATATGELSIDVRLCSTPQPRISQVTLSSTGCQPGDDDAMDVEALVRGDSEGSYSSLGYGAVPRSGTLTIGTGDPLIGRELRLRFVPRDGAKHAVCAGQLTVR